MPSGLCQCTSIYMISIFDFCSWQQGAPRGTFFHIVTGIKIPQESTQHRSMILKNCFYRLACRNFFIILTKKKRGGGGSIEALSRICHGAEKRVNKLLMSCSPNPNQKSHMTNRVFI